MPQFKHFKLPDVGEGLTEAEIVSWKVKPGDTVKVNEIVVEIETAKSLVELPSPFAGQVSELLAQEGQTVDVGSPIITVDVDPSGAPASTDPSGAPATTGPSAAPASGSAPSGTSAAASAMPAEAADTVPDEAWEVATPPEEGAVEPGLIGGPAPGGRTSVLVGYGPRTTEAKRRPRKGSVAAVEAVPTEAAPEPVETTPEPVAVPEPEPAAGTLEAPQQPTGGSVRVLAKPPVRKLAKDLGVDLSDCTPTGPGGTLTRDDVRAVLEGAGSGADTLGQDEAASAAVPAPRGARTGERETRIAIKGVRKMTAQAMVSSAFSAPHVTEFITVDVTRTMRLVERLKTDRDLAGVRVSPLLVVAKALLIAARRNPGINATWDEGAGEIIVKHYVNLGIAAATPRGLVVPNIKDADAMSLAELADALTSLTSTAREGRTQPADMSGGTITITNVGVFGVDSGTPILNQGEAAILCFGAVRQQPWVHKGKVKPRWVTQLALSFDHRLVDGDLGSRFIADVAAILEDPSRALVWS